MRVNSELVVHGSEKDAGENDKSYFAGLCLGYLVQKRHSI
jgi:hypothetical protein